MGLKILTLIMLLGMMIIGVPSFAQAVPTETVPGIPQNTKLVFVTPGLEPPLQWNYNAGSNYVFYGHTESSETPQYRTIFTLSKIGKHQFRIEDVIISFPSDQNYFQIYDPYFELRRGNEGEDNRFLFVQFPYYRMFNYGRDYSVASNLNFIHTFNIVLNPGEHLTLGYRDTLDYTITGTLL